MANQEGEMMDKRKLERLRNTKKAKQENSFLLGAAVAFLSRTGIGKLGQIVKISKSLLKVKWDDGTTELFGRAGQPFYGKVDESGEAIRATASGKPIEDLWGTEDGPHLTLATDSVKQTLAEKRKKGEESRAQRQAERARIEADPAYQKRQTDLKRYSEMLTGLGANVENSWNDAANFRIELDGIKPDRMEKLVEAIKAALTR